MVHEITDSPTALPGTTAGTTYFIVNKTGGDLWIESANSAPANTRAAFPIPYRGWIYKSHDAGESLWIQGEVSGGTVVFEEAA